MNPGDGLLAVPLRGTAVTWGRPYCRTPGLASGVLLRYRYRVHPTAPQRVALSRAFGMFLARLESQAARAGRTFVKVDRFFPSTRLCSACGALTGPSGLEGLKIREWACGCGAFHDRDRNAEIDIRCEGQRLAREGVLVAAGLADT